jgi:N-acetylglucosamine transport system permease protein
MWRVFSYSVAIVFSVFIVGPLLWLLMNSFKPTGVIMNSPFSLPDGFYLGNYEAVTQSNFWRFYFNSLLVTFGSLAGIALVSTTMAYGLSRFRFRGREITVAIIFAAIMLPPALVVIPLFRQIQAYGLLDSHLGLMLVYIAFALPLSVFILRAFFMRIPEDLSDAARVDGASEWRVFFSVILPIARPPVVTVMILWFVWLFNEYILSLVLLQTTNQRTLPVGLTLLNSEYGVNFGALAAALVMSAVPIIVVYWLFSDRFVKGMTAGAIKG